MVNKVEEGYLRMQKVLALKICNIIPPSNFRLFRLIKHYLSFSYSTMISAYRHFQWLFRIIYILPFGERPPIMYKESNPQEIVQSLLQFYRFPCMLLWNVISSSYAFYPYLHRLQYIYINICTCVLQFLRNQLYNSPMLLVLFSAGYLL